MLLAPGGSKPVDTGIFQSPFSFIGTSSESELETDTASVMTVDQSYQVPPAIPSAGNVGDVYCPSRVAFSRNASASLYPRSRRLLSMVKESPFELQDPVDGLLVNQHALPVSQYGPYPSISVGR